MKNCSVAKLNSLNMVIASKTHLLLISFKKENQRWILDYTLFNSETLHQLLNCFI